MHTRCHLVNLGLSFDIDTKSEQSGLFGGEVSESRLFKVEGVGV